MTARKYTKRKSNKAKFPLLLLFIGVFMVGIFIFSITMLSGMNEKKNDTSAQQVKITKAEFVNKISPHAKEIQLSYGVLPSIIIGQAILESNFGQSELAMNYNNLFGIKAYGEQKKVTLETQEYVNDVWITIQGDFRVYKSWEESMNDHVHLFVNGVSWNPRLYKHVLLAKNYKEAAYALQKSGYATDPDYAEKIINVVETYHLDKYDHQ
ncbi:glycoside hydrolase family 73 protein [Melissococcus plutonius]|uniref:N-acetylmuramoyl-L-alanine amidase n=1 Tax=Melissococcus plutonius (strain ATCC 35311 / DSM 29964 / CIP 104052 / LMG 20360 / NCIMB 702443) TaxID=940190 RepID=F3YBB7_MELPT|nr:glycoside hydrolase family 73 protein [Melissococcus plutonius]AIM25196.1 Exo-glucosaminidase LytG [Melissococcus plutonius S1]KMT23830.1 Exo-glucosaminidase LytG [Melissococcus plutonius]KMT24353.1 Exo-glucosaminidase LytG [Melissococcus plutonius]KMT25926.1 Exo-glucosaminidase LytG [Melissococcus plutonius]KMT28477.1 Exo-glucosaminidase LytG [Melissococcus plutonius]